MSESLLTTAELELIVEKFETIKLEDIGKKHWFKRSQEIFKIYQVASIEASSSSGTERVFKAFTLYNKVEPLIKDVVTLSLWKEKVFPALVTLTPQPESPFPTYIVLYGEVIILGILQSLLFHSEAFNYISDSSDDLIDYAVSKISKLLCVKSKNLTTDDIRMRKMDAIEELKEQKDLIDFNIGSQCISVVRYICENFDKLPLSAASRIYTTHDVPILITHLLDMNTWSNHVDGKFYKHNDNEWKEWLSEDPVLSKTECQVWLLLRQLLINPTCDTVYYYSTFRKEQLSKLIKLLHDRVIDQLSPLEDLKNWLNTLLISPSKGENVHNPLIVEVTTSYKDELSLKYEDQWDQIASKRSKLLFYGSPNDKQAIAKSFAASLDTIEEINDNLQSCIFCFNRAFKRCSKCKKVWYCSRKCQVQHWSAHKTVCVS
ncbi:zinc finger MYND domain-containing protein 10 [Cimex lectularius]|uniref:MYND-type domain-containing protein n=1 Tax=Cimex lectularius TaxID=79782 RepID=A0A8I6SDK5_CIMLE|nr:zinc finger MYND domain-containing protein 10 [Cimex lectularius]